jgi:hypothetical protein
LRHIPRATVYRIPQTGYDFGERGDVGWFHN